MMVNRPGPGKETRFEELLFQGGRAVLDGRSVSLQMDQSQREALLEQMLREGPQLAATLDSVIEDLEAILETDALHCLAVLSVLYLMKDPETYLESEDDRPPSHVEFLALRAVPFIDRAGEVDSRPGPSQEEAPTSTSAEATAPGDDSRDDEAAEGAIALARRKLNAVQSADRAAVLVRQAFDLSIELSWHQFVERSRREGADAGFEGFRRHAIQQSLTVRHNAYPEHVEAILRGCLDPFEDQCRELLGFTAAEAWELTHAVHALARGRVDALQLDMVRQFRDACTELARARRKKRLDPVMAALSPSEQKTMVRRLVEADVLYGAVEATTFTGQDLADESGLSEEVASAWLTAFTCTPDLYDARHHRLPCGAHPVTQRPVFAVGGGGYMVPAPTSLGEAIRPLMEDRLRAAGSVWDRYVQSRARWVEVEAAQRLADALPGSASWTGAGWAGAEDSSDLDGLVACDDFTARIQCKAGRVSAAARRGAPSMAEDVQTVINDAAVQHARLAAALTKQDGADLGFNEAQVEALSAPLNVEVIVCIDDVTVWATETHKLRHLVALPDSAQTPWVLSLSDLMAVTDLLDGVELVHYVTRRIRLESEGRVEAHDELDWVGHYIRDGLLFDHVFDQEHPPDVYRLLTFTEAIDEFYFARGGLLQRTVTRPRPALPDALRGLLGLLEKVRPKHWVLAGLVLLHGDDAARQQVAELIDHMYDGATNSARWAGSKLYPEHTVVVFADLMMSGPPLRRRAHAYWEANVAHQGRPNGVTLTFGVDGKVAVDLVENDPSRTIAHQVLVRRPHPPQS